jgi:hypothetical protein
MLTSLFQSWAAATFSPILGFCCSMASWLGTTYATAGEITIESTGANHARRQRRGIVLATDLHPVAYVRPAIQASEVRLDLDGRDQQG